MNKTEKVLYIFSLEEKAENALKKINTFFNFIEIYSSQLKKHQLPLIRFLQFLKNYKDLNVPLKEIKSLFKEYVQPALEDIEDIEEWLNEFLLKNNNKEN